MKLKVMMTSLVFLAASAFSSDWATFKSSAGFYQVQYPTSWKLQMDGNVTNVMTPNGEGAITISAYHADSEDFNDFMNIPRRVFAKAEVISPFESLKTEKKNGFKGEFRTKESDGHRRWLVRALHSKHVFVFITANDSDDMFQQHREDFSKIIDSLEIHDTK